MHNKLLALMYIYAQNEVDGVMYLIWKVQCPINPYTKARFASEIIIDAENIY